MHHHTPIEQASAVFMILVPLIVIGGVLTAVVGAVVSHRRAQRRGEITLGAVGLAARIWGWEQLVGYVVGLIIFGLIVLLIVFAVTHPDPPKARSTTWDPVPAPYTRPAHSREGVPW